MKKSTTKKRAGVRVSSTRPSAGSTAAVRGKSRGKTVPLVFERWGTMGPPLRPGALPSVCLWGVREDAEMGRDPDEKVVRVRVEILEVVD